MPLDRCAWALEGRVLVGGWMIHGVEEVLKNHVCLL